MGFDGGRFLISSWVISALLFYTVPASAAATSYEIVDLGPLAMASSQAASINNSGHIAFNALAVDGAEHTYLYRNGQSEDIGSLGGGFSLARHINELDEVVGHSRLSVWSGTEHAFRYRDGQMTDLGALDSESSWARGNNDKGVIVGEAYTRFSAWVAVIFDPATGVPRDLNQIAPVWTPTRAWDLQRANAVNNAGQIVGVGVVGTPSFFGISNGAMRGFMYDGLTLTELGTLGGYTSNAVDINAAGEIVGYAALPDGALHAFLYNGQQMLDLGTLSDGKVQGNSFASAINNFGQVVGTVDILYTPSKAFIYEPQGSMRELGGAVRQLTGWDYLAAAWDINDLGEIVGLGYKGGVPHTFLLQPLSIADRVCEHAPEVACAKVQ
jgi:probable HAF family extracellular repeat protein